MDLQILLSGSGSVSGLEGGGVTAEKELIAFAEAAFGDDKAAIAEARGRLEQAIGREGMIDAAGVIANFQRMVKIADGTGIPLDKPVAMVTADIRDELGINEFGSADNTPATNMLERWFGRAIRPFLSILLPKIAKSSEHDGLNTTG